MRAVYLSCNYEVDRWNSVYGEGFTFIPGMEIQIVLILTRKVGESIMLGDQVRVVVVDVKGHQVRIGVDAPREMKVYRGEIFDKIQEENNRASRVDAKELKNVANLWSRMRAGRRGSDGD